MKALFWLLDKLFAILADVGILCIVVLLVADDGTTPLIICSVVGLLLAAVGAFIGRKIWEYDIAPFSIFLSWMHAEDSATKYTILWAGRFFLLAFVGAGIYYVLV